MRALLRSCLSCSYLLVALFAPVHAAAQDGGMMDMSDSNDEQAKAHFKVGKTLYETGRFAEAAQEFEQAYALSKKEELLYNAYIAYRDATDVPHAIDALRRYLGVATLEPAARVNLEARLHAMEEAGGRTETAASAPAATTAESGAGASQRSSLAAPEAAPAAAPVTPAAAPAAQARPAARRSPLPYVLAIGGGTVLAAGLVTALVTSSKISSLEDDCPDDVCPPDYDLDGHLGDARTWRTLSLVLVGAGAVSTAVGTALLLGSRGTERPAAAHAALACAPGACMGTLRASF